MKKSPTLDAERRGIEPSARIKGVSKNIGFNRMLKLHIKRQL